MTQGKRKHAPKGPTHARHIVDVALTAGSMSHGTEAVDGDLLVVVATCVADDSVALGAWPGYQDQGKRVRALLETAFKNARKAEEESK